MAGKRGRGQANALDKLDQALRDKCINLLLEGKRGAGAQVARLAGVSRQAIDEYRKRHLVKARELAVKIARAEAAPNESISATFERAASSVPAIASSLPILAAREERLRQQQDRHNRMLLVMKERSEDMVGVPGGASGLLCRQIKQIGNGENAEKVEEYKLDQALLSEFREHEKMIAQELGQWNELGSASQATPLLVPIQVNVQINAEPDVCEDLGSK